MITRLLVRPMAKQQHERVEIAVSSREGEQWIAVAVARVHIGSHAANELLQVARAARPFHDQPRHQLVHQRHLPVKD